MKNFICKAIMGTLLLATTAIAFADTSYVTCYYNNDQKWHWGLSPNGSYQQITGSWEKTANTKIYQFHTSNRWDKKALLEVCKTTLEQKDIYSPVTGIYAAESNFGKNYMIVHNGVEVKP